MSKKKSCLPPDQNTRLPAFKLPPKACDAHCHVFGPAAEFPYHFSSTYEPPDSSKFKLRKLHDKIGVERAVLVQASCHGPDNRALLNAIAWSGGKWRGVCIASPDFSDDDFKTLDDGGVRGVRFNFVAHLGGAPDLNNVRRVVERVKPLGWHLVIHVNAEDLIQYASFFNEFEDVPVVVDHMGRVPAHLGIDQPAFKILLTFMTRGNWWVKVSGAERISKAGPPFYDSVPFAQALIEAAPDRCLWGTDFPHPNIKQYMPNDGDLVDLIPLFTDDPVQQRKLLVDNPARLYGFEDVS
jgi:2-pyrone-4,6-dicarboxylate lactonase